MVDESKNIHDKYPPYILRQKEKLELKVGDIVLFGRDNKNVTSKTEQKRLFIEYGLRSGALSIDSLPMLLEGKSRKLARISDDVFAEIGMTYLDAANRAGMIPIRAMHDDVKGIGRSNYRMN